MPAPKVLTMRNPLAMWGAEMRHYRNKAGLTQTELGDLVGYSTQQVSALETADRAPNTKLAVRLDEVLDTGGALDRFLEYLLDAFPSLSAMREMHPVWFRDWVDAERRATVIRSFQLSVVDGLLQTEDYARALLDGDEAAVSARMERQQVLHREEPPPPVVRIVLDEGVLHRPVGDGRIMREQLQHLVEMATSTPNVTVQVVPLGAYPGIRGSFALARLDDGEVAYIETITQGHVVSDEDRVVAVADIWDSIRTHALSQRESIELIKRTVEQKWT